MARLTVAKRYTEEAGKIVFDNLTVEQIDVLIAAIVYDTSGIIDRLDCGPGAPRDAQQHCERAFQRSSNKKRN